MWARKNAFRKITCALIVCHTDVVQNNMELHSIIFCMFISHRIVLYYSRSYNIKLYEYVNISIICMGCIEPLQSSNASLAMFKSLWMLVSAKRAHLYIK